MTIDEIMRIAAAIRIAPVQIVNNDLGGEFIALRVALHQLIKEEREKMREAIIALATEKGWAMKNEDPFEDAVCDICDEVVRRSL